MALKFRNRDLWYCVTTQAAREKWAMENVLRQGHQAYLPLMERQLLVGPKSKRRVVLQRVPLFPRYLFVCTTHGQWHFLNGTFGVTGIVMIGEEPVPVPVKVLKLLKSRETADGIVDLPPPPSKYEMGDEVRVTEGPMAGFIGIYQGMHDRDRIRVLLQLFGRDNPMILDRKSVEPVDE